MTYAEAKERIFASAIRPEGYNGHTVRVGLAFDDYNKLVVEVYQHGFHTSPVFPAVDNKEAAIQALTENPACIRFYSQIEAI
jgi:hypothetical protein